MHLHSPSCPLAHSSPRTCPLPAAPCAPALLQLAAKKEGYSDVVYLDAKTDTYLEEVSSCNIFVVKGKTIRTPPLQVGAARCCRRLQLLLLCGFCGCRGLVVVCCIGVWTHLGECCPSLKVPQRLAQTCPLSSPTCPSPRCVPPLTIPCPAPLPAPRLPVPCAGHHPAGRDAAVCD
jgi:hypothetical protein